MVETQELWLQVKEQMRVFMQIFNVRFINYLKWVKVILEKTK